MIRNKDLQEAIQYITNAIVMYSEQLTNNVASESLHVDRLEGDSGMLKQRIIELRKIRQALEDLE